MWLVARPLGGLNDILCTIHRCYQYCIQFNRKLIIHTAHDSDHTLFADGIEHYFYSNDITLGVSEKGEYYSHISQSLNLSFNQLPWQANPSHLKQSTSLSRGWHEPVLLYSGCGGGNIGINSFKYLSILPEIKSYISAKMALLPARYEAVHCRYTDYKSDLGQLWQIMDSISTATSIYLATDSSSVLADARKRYPDRILNYSRSLSSSMQPIHHSGLALAEETVYDMFLDLGILSLAQATHCTRLVNPTIESIPYSGFCILAQSLKNLPRDQLSKIFTLYN